MLSSISELSGAAEVISVPEFLMRILEMGEGHQRLPRREGIQEGWCVLLGRKQSSLTPCLLGGQPMKSSKQAGGQSLAGGTD